MKTRIGLSLAAISIFLGGCTTIPQEPIQLSQNTLTSKASRVGVAMTPLPKVDTTFIGASCLLCLAAASTANSTLTNYAHTLPYEDLTKLRNYVADRIHKIGPHVVVIADDLRLDTLSDYSGKGPNVAKKDFSSFKQKYKIDKLLVIEIDSLGFVRTYSAYIPTSDPKGEFRGAGYIVNLNDNTYEWYMPVDITKSADSKWDEPPKYPGLTNAYFQALEIGKDSFLKPFSN